MSKFENYLKQLPVIPAVAHKILQEAEEMEEISFKELEEMIKVDPLLTAKILKVANSALYARQREITTLQMAITLLGFKNIRSLVLLTVASNLWAKYKKTGFYEQFWKHSLLSAFIARELIAKDVKSLVPDEGFLAGLLHDVGQVAMFHARQEEYLQVVEERAKNRGNLKDLEQRLLGATHKEVGAEVLAAWNFPHMYVDAAREHGMANITSEYRTLIITVSIADILAVRVVHGGGNEEKEELISRLLLYLSIPPERTGYYTGDFIEKLLKDPLFVECQNLFHISMGQAA